MWTLNRPSPTLEPDMSWADEDSEPGDDEIPAEAGLILASVGVFVLFCAGLGLYLVSM
jgi:hypothetical protein